MNAPTVSVVMSVFNATPFLREAIESILAQTFDDFEFIVINDGSTDRSTATLDYYQQRDSRVRIYHQENRGLIASLNRGCRLAKGLYIARMDADDVAMPNRLRHQVERMRENAALGLLGGAAEWINAAGRSLGIHRYPGTDQAIRSALKQGSPFAHSSILMRREAFISTGGYRPAVIHAEDYDLWLRIAERFETANLQAVMVKYRIHPGQISEQKCEQQALSSLVARAAAQVRSSGQPDPLDSVGEITPEVLERLQITQSAQHSALARHLLTRLRNMCNSDQDSQARRALDSLRTHHIEHAEDWVKCDVGLIEARLFWRQRSFARSISTAARAILTRPIVLGRPVRRLIHRVMSGLEGRREAYRNAFKQSQTSAVNH